MLINLAESLAVEADRRQTQERISLFQHIESADKRELYAEAAKKHPKSTRSIHLAVIVTWSGLYYMV